MRPLRLLPLLLFVLGFGAALTAACGASGASMEPTVTLVPVVTQPATTVAPTTVPVVGAAASTVDATRLPLGDGKVSTSARAGYVWRCGNGGGGGPAGGAFRDGPWIDGGNKTFNRDAKAVVDGSVTWQPSLKVTVEGTTRRITTNDLPNHPTGVYPIAPGDDAYAYDRNPNSIKAQSINLSLPSKPVAAAQPSCLTPGAIGVMLTGSVVFDALDAPGRDALAHEIQDGCAGHPEVTGAYHYHSLTSCIADGGSGHSALLGYAIDGFGLYGSRGEGGTELTDADLDECHGHTHEISWDGQTVVMYHYHFTAEYPYSLSCFRGTPLRLPR